MTEVEKTLNLWKGRDLPTLTLLKQALEVYTLSKVWYAAQIVPLPRQLVGRLQAAAGSLLWRGRLERLKWDELENPVMEGGIGLVNIQARAEVLLVKQACHRLGGGGAPEAHLRYWLGLRLGRRDRLGGGAACRDDPGVVRAARRADSRSL